MRYIALFLLAFLGLAAFADAAPRVRVRVGRVASIRVAPVRVARVAAIRRVAVRAPIVAVRAPIVVRQAVVLRQRAIYSQYVAPAQIVERIAVEQVAAPPVEKVEVPVQKVEVPVQRVILRQEAGYGCGAAAIRVQRIRIY